MYTCDYIVSREREGPNSLFAISEMIIFYFEIHLANKCSSFINFMNLIKIDYNYFPNTLPHIIEAQTDRIVWVTQFSTKWTYVHLALTEAI